MYYYNSTCNSKVGMYIIIIHLAQELRQPVATGV